MRESFLINEFEFPTSLFGTLDNNLLVALEITVFVNESLEAQVILRQRHADCGTAEFS